MCGLAGFLNLNREPVSSVILKKMTDEISHRGPDGEGFWIGDGVGIGHRRLAIIDLSEAGHQPMMSRDGRFVMAYNGEVYNYQEIRLELESRGYRFHSKTDSEVVLNAFVEWGADSFLKFNGMFALAIWDKKEKCLTLARDRYGIKPLYYAKQGSLFLFGSESKSFLKHPAFKSDIDKEGLLEYFTFQNFFTNKTLLESVHLVEAGTYLEMPLQDNAGITKTRYWDYHFREPTEPNDEEEYLEELDRLFCQAVSRQLISDVDVGAYLSGGMDSGSITALAAKELPYIKSFTCGFDLNSASGLELSFDEREAAEYMSYVFKTEHYEMILKAGDMERAIPSLAWHLEEPRVGQSYPNYYAAQLASKFVKVVLSGAGGDELFGGYPWRYYRAVVNDDFDHYVDKYYDFWQRLIPYDLVKNFFGPIWGDIKHVQTLDIFKSVFTEHANELKTPEDYVNHSLYFEAKTFLHGLLVVEDKISMAHSLETRVPFLDNDLVDFAMKLPTNMKLGNLGNVVRLNENEVGAKTSKYFQKTRDGKLILRKMMKRHIPEKIVEREKQGFSAPDASWFKGESIEYVKNRLLDDKAKIYDFMDKTAVQKLINEHLDGKQNRRLLIWSLLNTEQILASL